MMTDKQLNFRQDYRSRVAGWHNSYVHVFVIYAIGIPAMYIYIGHIENLLWWECFTIPAIALLCNLFEWFLHEEIMHRPQKMRRWPPSTVGIP